MTAGKRIVIGLGGNTLLQRGKGPDAEARGLLGRVYDDGHARRLATGHGWQIAADGDKWRPVVPSLAPVRVVETPIVDSLLGGPRRRDRRTGRHRRCHRGYSGHPDHFVTARVEPSEFASQRLRPRRGPS